jgi:hypothetical protein
MFHKHEWEILSETTTESQIEQLKRLGTTKCNIYNGMLDRKHIIILICKKCGKLKRFVEDI